MKTKNRVLIVVSVLFLFLTLLPSWALAEETQEEYPMLTIMDDKTVMVDENGNILHDYGKKFGYISKFVNGMALVRDEPIGGRYWTGVDTTKRIRITGGSDSFSSDPNDRLKEIAKKFIDQSNDGYYVIDEAGNVLSEGSKLPLEAGFQNGTGGSESPFASYGIYFCPVLFDENGTQITLWFGLNSTSYIRTDVAPFFSGEELMLPLRAIAERYRGRVEWDGETQTVTIQTGRWDRNQKQSVPVQVVLQIGNQGMKITDEQQGGQTAWLSTPPVIRGDRTFVPQEAIQYLLSAGEFNDAKKLIVDWNPSEKRVSIIYEY